MWRSFPRRVISVALLPVLVQGASARAATGDVAKKRREAARISAEIDRVSTRIEQLNEDYLESKDRLSAANRRVANTQRERETLETQLTTLRAQVRDSALRALAEPDGGGLSAFDDAASFSDFERRLAIEAQAGGRTADLNDELRSNQQDLARVGRRLDRAKRDAATSTALLRRKRAEADALLKQLEALQASTTGELAQLVREEEARMAAAEAAAARRAIEQRRVAAQRELAAAREAERRRAAAAQASRARTGGARTSQAPVTAAERSAAARVRVLAVEAGEVPSLPSSPGAASAVRLALDQVGKPYVWGAEGPGSFDCSGLMLYAWRAQGRRLPHSSRIQFSTTTRVPVSDMRPGDLVFFGRPIHHVGMYIGGGKMVEASRRGRPVRVSGVFRKDLVGVGRVG